MSLNDYTFKQREGSKSGNAAKHSEQRKAEAAIEHSAIEKHEGAVDICICWVEESRKRDWDNVTYAAKFILDALTDKGIIVADNQRFLPRPILNVAAHDSDNPRIIVLVDTYRKAGWDLESFGRALKAELGHDPLNDAGAM